MILCHYRSGILLRNQLMSQRQNKREQPDHSSSLGQSVLYSTRIALSVYMSQRRAIPGQFRSDKNKPIPRTRGLGNADRFLLDPVSEHSLSSQGDYMSEFASRTQRNPLISRNADNFVGRTRLPPSNILSALQTWQLTPGRMESANFVASAERQLLLTV